jgi:hypothetical protein
MHPADLRLNCEINLIAVDPGKPGIISNLCFSFVQKRNAIKLDTL